VVADARGVKRALTPRPTPGPPRTWAAAWFDSLTEYERLRTLPRPVDARVSSAATGHHTFFGLLEASRWAEGGNALGEFSAALRGAAWYCLDARRGASFARFW